MKTPKERVSTGKGLNQNPPAFRIHSSFLHHSECPQVERLDGKVQRHADGKPSIPFCKNGKLTNGQNDDFDVGGSCVERVGHLRTTINITDGVPCVVPTIFAIGTDASSHYANGRLRIPNC